MINNWRKSKKSFIIGTALITGLLAGCSTDSAEAPAEATTKLVEGFKGQAERLTLDHLQAEERTTTVDDPLHKEVHLIIEIKDDGFVFGKNFPNEGDGRGIQYDTDYFNMHLINADSVQLGDLVAVYWDKGLADSEKWEQLYLVEVMTNIKEDPDWKKGEYYYSF